MTWLLLYFWTSRSKISWTEDGEKTNYCNKLISSLEVDGKLIKDQNNIAKAENDFFQKLYSEKLNWNDDSYKESLNDFLINNNTKKLTNQEKDTCDQDITENEILTSLNQLCNGKTPGTDGLPPDFYKFFWIDIK